MRIAVLFDGAGLARLGLEQAGHDCTGFELNPVAHHLSQMVGSGNCVLADVRDVDLSGFEGVWASPPCQRRSLLTTGAAPRFDNPYSEDLFDWACALPHPLLWVENVRTRGLNGWLWNAAQFEATPRQNRNRVVWGRYPLPHVHAAYRPCFRGVCGAIAASDYSKGGQGRKSRSSSRLFYGRRLTVEEAAYHQGFEIPPGWYQRIEGFAPGQWRNQLYQAIGNGVPVYMARAFGEANVAAWLAKRLVAAQKEGYPPERCVTTPNVPPPRRADRSPGSQPFVQPTPNAAAPDHPNRSGPDLDDDSADRGTPMPRRRAEMTENLPCRPDPSSGSTCCGCTVRIALQRVRRLEP